MSIEAACTRGWEKYAHASVGIDTFGASGKGAEVMAWAGFSVENCVEKATKVMEFYAESGAPSLTAKPF